MSVLKHMKCITGTIVVALERSWRFGVIWLWLVVIVPATVCAQSQSRSVDLRASVSKTVTLSLSGHLSQAGTEVNAFENTGELRIVVSGSEFKRTLEVPILIRSNTAYKINASAQSQTAVLTQLRVLSIEANGRLVAGDAVTGVAVRPQLDMRTRESSIGEENLSTIDTSVPFTIFSGPRISLSGGLGSPQNALKVVLLLSVQAKEAQRSWTLDLNLQEGSETDLPW